MGVADVNPLGTVPTFIDGDILTGQPVFNIW